MNTGKKFIGILGGLGPYAGLDLNRKIFDQTEAITDQEHLSVVLFSSSGDIPDRTEFLLNLIEQNPAEPIYEILKKMDKIGVNVVGIPCNTTHSPKIFEVIKDRIRTGNLHLELVDMIKEIGNFLTTSMPLVSKAGVLATTGTVLSKVYSDTLGRLNIEVAYPDVEVQKTVHQSIYDKVFGIKANSGRITDKVIRILFDAIDHLCEKDCDVIILGCTELPLALDAARSSGIEYADSLPIIDSTLILARALIKRVAPEKLKPSPYTY